VASQPRQLGVRTLSACLFVPAVLALTWLGGLPLAALVAAIVGRGAWEFYRMAAARQLRPDAGLGVALSLGAVAWMAWRGEAGLALVLVGLVVVILAAALRHGVESYGADTLTTLGGVLYVGLLGSAPLLIERLTPGAGPLMALIFASIWLADAAAYLGGSRWGGRRLIPRISPGKTVVGFAFGCVAGLVPALAHGRLPGLELTGMGLPHLVGLLALVSVGGQVGDLVESAFKRYAGVKDAPALIPGHGGVLDRFDSYLFAFPLAYLYLAALAALAP